MAARFFLLKITRLKTTQGEAEVQFDSPGDGWSVHFAVFGQLSHGPVRICQDRPFEMPVKKAVVSFWSLLALCSFLADTAVFLERSMTRPTVLLG